MSKLWNLDLAAIFDPEVDAGIVRVDDSFDHLSPAGIHQRSDSFDHQRNLAEKADEKVIGGIIQNAESSEDNFSFIFDRKSLPTSQTSLEILNKAELFCGQKFF
jgi:hypothetical protein